jgi:DNA polymerase-3 subunit epsilon
MKLFFDTETNGLPDYNKRARDPSQPHIVQLAAIMVDDALVPQERYNVICKPDGWEISEELAAIHGISHARALEVGIPEAEACTTLLRMIREAEQICAFNVSFDKFIARIGMRRFGLITDEDDQWWKALPTYCVMKPMTDICRIPFPNGRGSRFKWPKLHEAYRHAFNEELEGAHDALVDIMATIRLYQFLHAPKIVPNEVNNQPAN